MKINGTILILIFTVSCSSNKEMTLEQYLQQPIKFAKQKVNYPNNDFTLFIPHNWFWKVETYENDNIILGIDAASLTDKDGFVDLISIQKLKSFGNTTNIKVEFEYWLNLLKNNSQNGKILESGQTQLFNQKAYFFHTKSDSGTYGESERITFILESNTKGVFYNLTVAASQTGDLKNNMAILVQSIRTFEINNDK
jgi:hypothetical protein